MFFIPISRDILLINIHFIILIINSIMKRKDYRRPTMKVVELQHRTMILTGSGEGKLATPGGFNQGGDPLDDE